jgi:hypothetical protein
MKHLFIIMSLFLCVSIANAENIFDGVLAAKDKSDAEIQLTFSDNYKLKMKGPINIKEIPNRGRSVIVYEITFTDDKGKRETREVSISHFGDGKSFKYIGADGASYVVTGVRDNKNSNPKEEVEEDKTKGTCIAEGKMKKESLLTRKMIPSDGKNCPVNGTVTCLGEKIVKCSGIVSCNEHPEYGSDRYEIFCVSKDGRSCPTEAECMADVAYEKFVEDAQNAGMDIYDARNGVDR